MFTKKLIFVFCWDVGNSFFLCHFITFAYFYFSSVRGSIYLKSFINGKVEIQLFYIFYSISILMKFDTHKY